MKNVSYEKDVEVKPNGSPPQLGGTVLPADLNVVTRLSEWEDDEENKVVFEAKEGTGEVYPDGGVVGHELSSWEAKEYLEAIVGNKDSQPWEKNDEPIFYEEASEDSGWDYMSTGLPNPRSVTLDGDIEMGIAIRAPKDNKIYDIAINFEVEGLDNFDEKMNDGYYRINLERDVAPEADNELEELRKGLEGLEDIASSMGLEGY